VLKRKTRLLRLHFDGKPSIEGIFLGFEAGHYRLANAQLLLEDPARTVELGDTWVPRDRVLHIQRLG
jgi:hypothetical protein